MDVCFDMYIRKPLQEYVTINKKSRPIFKVFIPNYIPENNSYAYVKTKNIKPLYNGKQEELIVYMQSHAINRLIERTDPISMSNIKICFSLGICIENKPEIINNKLFFPYKINEIKIGYFLADIIDDKIVIRTFILITHTSAPEGRNFQELTGFTKYDMNYWNISKLQTFVFNEMNPDNPLYEYFEQSNLLDLFNLDKELGVDIESKKNKADWQALHKCLNKYHQRDILSNVEIEEVHSLIQ